MAFLSTTPPVKQVTSQVAGFALPTASSGSVPAGSEGGAKTLSAPVQGMAGATGIGGNGPATATAASATTAAQPPAKPSQSFISSLGLGKNPEGPGIPTASGQTLTAPKLPGDSRTSAEKELARQQTISTLQPMNLAQQGTQGQIRQTAAAAGLSPEVTAGMQQLALMQGAQDVRSRIADVTNSSYGYAAQRLSAEETRKAQQQADAMDALLTANVGTDLWDQTIDAAIAMDPENTYYRTLKENPGLVKILGDANLGEIKKANSANSAVVLNSITDPTDEGQLTGGFGQWRDAQFSGIGNLLEAEALTYNWEDSSNQEDILEYERLYKTTLDPNSAADRETAAAWSQYRDAVRLVTKGQVQEDLANDLLNGGVELTPENLAKLEGIAGTITGMMEGSAKLGGVVADWDGDLENGAFSIFFTDWYGKDIPGALPSDPFQSNLNELWKEYVRQTGGQDMVSRDEFFAMADGKVPATETIPGGSVASVLRDMGLGRKTPGIAPEDMSITEAIASIDDPTVWETAPTWTDMPHFDYYEGQGNPEVLKNRYTWGAPEFGPDGKPIAPARKTPWATAGTLFTGPDGRQYRIAEDDSVRTDVGDNTIGVFVKVQDLEDKGKVRYIQIGKHKRM